jgi:cytochrome bd-type quinol oxidase subunit 2
METQSIIVLAVVWLIVAIPAIYFIVKGSSGDCRDSEKKMTKYSAWGALAFVTFVVLLIYFAVTNGWSLCR